jgi:lipoprotein-releasing system permease protein
MALTVGIASVNVVSALSTLAMERAGEIAILKCLGARPGDMILLFSLSGALLGAIGSVVGGAGGMLASMHVNEIIAAIERTLNLARGLLDFGAHARPQIRLLDPAFYLERIPVSIRFSEIASIVVATTTLSMCSAFLPAWRSAKLRPLDIFRKH